MKGDFSFLAFDPAKNYTGVLHQQGRVLLDRDWNEAGAIDARWRDDVGRAAFGAGVLAVPAATPLGWKVIGAAFDGTKVVVELAAGRAWADGLPVSLPATAKFDARYLAPPLQSPQASTSTIEGGVRDLVVLEVWEDAVNGFQDPPGLIEPALGGPDTTERTRAFARPWLMRLGPNDDCSAVARVADDFGKKGRLTVSPAPVLTITGDCPVEAGGGYTGFEHYLYRVEIAEPAGGQARLKWSQFNGGLVGRGLFAAGTPGTGTVTITANDQMINHCGLADFYLEALAFDASLGSWQVVFTADATRSQDGILALTGIQGVWPAVAPVTGFFRLWNGIARVADFPVGGAGPVELKDGIRLEFDAPLADGSNYTPGDYWTFPVRASGAAFDPPVWPTSAPPQGVHHRRVALGIVEWGADLTASFDEGEIDDCRRIFRPLTNQKVCCTFNVGDGVNSRGDFDSIEEALRHLPGTGGEICLLPGLHHTNAVIANRVNVKIKGCDTRTKVIPRKGATTTPIFRISDSVGVSLEHMDMVTLGGTAVVVDASEAGATSGVEVAGNRILACENAIRVTDSTGVYIHHNRIRMLDKRDSGVAIYLAGDDSLIERNDIRLVPAPRLPPLDVPDEPDPIDPGDPCARLELVYVNARLFVSYVNTVWKLALPFYAVLVQPYRALGGIQIGGGSEHVRVLENVVSGGAGNGITLGSSFAVTPPPVEPTITVDTPDGRIMGKVVGPDGKAVAGVQVTLTSTSGGSAPSARVSNAQGEFGVGVAGGTYRVTEGAAGLVIDKIDFASDPRRRGVFYLTIVLKAEQAAPRDDFGFLYDIAIERNEINSMGLSGIGIPHAPAAAGVANTGIALASNLNAAGVARAALGNPVVGLAIRANRIQGCLRNPFDNVLRAAGATRGLGGISLGLCEDLAITDNRIGRNGTTAANPVCGIFVFYGEGVEIAHNVIVDNGPLTGNEVAGKLGSGRRGGIVLNLVTSFALLDVLGGARRLEIDPRPAARVHENVVDQPAGHALYAAAFGPVSCSDNAFASEVSGMSALEQLAGTVLILNLGGVNAVGAGTRINRVAANTVSAAAPAAADVAGAAPAAAAAAPIYSTFARTEVAERVFPGGHTQFHDNQSCTGAANTSFTCHTILAFDDLGYQGNQSRSARAGALLANGLLYGTTLRATTNRLSERGENTMASLFTVARLMNNTSFNQGDHCIIATDQNPAMAEVRSGNQVLHPSNLCAGLGMAAAIMFKPHG